MRARHIMSSPVTTVTGSTPIDECLRIIGTSAFTVLPVVDDAHHLVGIVTEGDLLREKFRTSDSGREGGAGTATAADTMTRPVVTMTADAEVSELASGMLRSGLRGIPIVHEQDVIGIVTRRDLIGVLLMDDARIAKEVQHRLDVYGGGEGRWAVEVNDAKVAIAGLAFDDPERDVIAALAETVPGVGEVHFV